MKRALALLLALALPADAALATKVRLAAPAQAARVALAGPVAVPVLAPTALALNAPAPAPVITPQAQAARIAELPALQASAAFDGGGAKGTPAVSGTTGAGAPRLRAPEPGPKKQKKAPTVLSTFKNAVGIGAIGAIAAPVLWNSVPLHYAIYALAASMAVPAVAVAVEYGRKLLRRPAPKPAGRSALRKARIAGLAVGLALTMTAHVIKPALIEAGASLIMPQKEIVLVQGTNLSSAIQSVIGENPVGAEVLDGLRDRGGVIRMPTFYIGKSEEAAATYISVLDAVVISRDGIRASGMTAEEFLADPAKQRAFAKDFYSTFLHELRHAGQFRRGLAFSGHFERAMDTEYEAYLTEIAYTHAALQKDPQADVSRSELWTYEEALDDVHGYLKSLDSDYEDNHKSKSRYWKRFFADLDARWPAIRVEGYTLLAKRAKYQRDKDRYMQKALEAAKEL